MRTNDLTDLVRASFPGKQDWEFTQSLSSRAECVGEGSEPTDEVKGPSVFPISESPLILSGAHRSMNNFRWVVGYEPFRHDERSIRTEPMPVSTA